MSYQHLQQSLFELEAACDASEAHGILCGILCCAGLAGADLWFAHLQVADDRRRLLAEWPASIWSALDGADMTFQPLLPADSEPLRERVYALGEWCSGALFGIALCGVERDAGIIDEIVRDLTEISKVDARVQDNEEGETCYAELVEYVRAAVLLLREQLQPRAESLRTRPNPSERQDH